MRNDGLWGLLRLTFFRIYDFVSTSCLINLSSKRKPNVWQHLRKQKEYVSKNWKDCWNEAILFFSLLKTAVSWSSGNEQNTRKGLLVLCDKEAKKTQTWMIGFYLSRHSQKGVGTGVVTVPQFLSFERANLIIWLIKFAFYVQGNPSRIDLMVSQYHYSHFFR